MTAVKVVDASALAAVVFDEPESGEVFERLSGARLISSDLLPFELENTCLKKCRREPNRRSDLAEKLRLSTGIQIEREPVDHVAVLAIALETGLTTYDASYLWLALEFDSELVTLDRALARAWEKQRQAG